MEYIEANGYDGLYSPGVCACKKDDLMPCDGMRNDCEPGYLCECDCGDHYFHIGPEKSNVIDVCSGDA